MNDEEVNSGGGCLEEVDEACEDMGKVMVEVSWTRKRGRNQSGVNRLRCGGFLILCQLG